MKNMKIKFWTCSSGPLHGRWELTVFTLEGWPV